MAVLVIGAEEIAADIDKIEAPLGPQRMRGRERDARIGGIGLLMPVWVGGSSILVLLRRRLRPEDPGS